MNSVRDSLWTIFRAVRYSFVFCLKNGKWLTIVRLFIAIAGTVLGYLFIQANGQMINAVQTAIKTFVHRNNLFIEISESGLVKPMLYVAVVMLTTRALDNYSWITRSRWNQTLRYANRRELQEHRSTLDVARIRSKEYDDLQRHIEELPNGWSTRINFSEEMVTLLTTVSSFIIFGTSLIWYNWIYAVIILVTSLPMIIVEFRLNSMWWNLFQNLVPEHKKRYVLERPYNSTTAFVQALMFNQMSPLRKKIDSNFDGIMEAHDNIRKTAVRKKSFSSTMTILGLIMVICHASWSVVMYSGGIGTLTIIIGAAKAFRDNLGAIVYLIAEQWNSVKGVILIEEDFFGLKSMLTTKYPVIPPKGITPEIKFENVSFSYPDTNRLVLENVSFTLPPGSKTAIVGASGNGKSTLQALLMRHYDPTSGSVLANGINLSNIEPSEWSRIASSLTQSYTVLERPIGEEIASSRMDDPINLEALKASSRFANFDGVVESDPEGFNSQIGVEFGGREFSGGERQRLALARVHYRGTPILVLDEPDASLDPESAQKIIDNVFALSGVTVVMITHHVSRAERCDNVIVMGKGKIVEQGTHEELVALNGVYVSLRNKDRKRLGGVSSDS